MSRYIDVDEMIDKLEELFRMRDDISKDGLSEAMELVHNMPTVDAVPVVHGRWVFNRYYTWECGNCGFHPFKGVIPKEPNFNFCPNCGCRMDGGDNERC